MDGAMCRKLESTHDRDPSMRMIELAPELRTGFSENRSPAVSPAFAAEILVIPNAGMTSGTLFVVSPLHVIRSRSRVCLRFDRWHHRRALNDSWDWDFAIRAAWRRSPASGRPKADAVSGVGLVRIRYGSWRTIGADLHRRSPGSPSQAPQGQPSRALEPPADWPRRSIAAAALHWCRPRTPQ